MKNILDNLKNILNILKKEIVILWIFSVLLEFALIALQLKNKLPLGKGDFVFISILALCVALYRPRWAFLVFVSLIPLENVILVSRFLPMQLRPYQYTGVILVAATIILWIFKKLQFKLSKPNWLDWLVFSLVPLSFLSLFNSPNNNIGLKNNLILLSFVVLYFLIRTLVCTRKHLVETTIFFLGSNIVVLIYGFFQVFADKFDTQSFEVMFGRPNATFTEPDWLGIYLTFSLAVLLSAIFFLKKNYQKYSVYFLIFSNITLLFLTLSRSAWIGAAVVTIFWLMFSLYKKEEQEITFTPKIFAKNLAIIFLISLISLIVIHFGKLSKFDLIDRARSTATSEQKITIACESDASVPQTVSSTDELTKYECQHINLEEIEFYKNQGKIVSVIFRKDPNVMTRSQIYKKSFEIIKKHPLVGVGFGTVTQTLGTDERGAGFNESNIFLQVWAGSGILGLIAIVAVILYLFIYAFRRISPFCPMNKIVGCPVVRDDFEKNLNIFLMMGISATIIPNLFNAGLFMGLFWLELGIFISCLHIKNPRTAKLKILAVAKKFNSDIF